MWVIVSRNQCNFCDSAKDLMEDAKLGYTEYNVQSPSSKWLLTLIKQAGITTVPQIWDNKGNHIGGYTELAQHLKGN